MLTYELLRIYIKIFGSLYSIQVYVVNLVSDSQDFLALLPVTLIWRFSMVLFCMNFQVIHPERNVILKTLLKKKIRHQSIVNLFCAHFALYLLTKITLNLPRKM